MDMCVGNHNKVYVMHEVNRGEEGIPVFILDASRIPFTYESEIITHMHNYNSLCYMPHPIPALAICDDGSGNDPPKVRVLALKNTPEFRKNSIIWQLQGRVEGKPCNPTGMVYVQDNQRLLVADGCNQRIIELAVQDGTFLRSTSLAIGFLAELFINNGDIFIHHRKYGKELISSYSINSTLPKFNTI